MSRYELWSDNSLKFCEFELADTAVIVRQGNRPTRGQPKEGQSTTKRFSSPDKARVAYEDLIAARLGTGKWQPPALSDRALIRIRSNQSSDARIRQLEEAARKSRRIQMQFELALRDEVVTVVIEMGVSRLRILFDDTRRKHGSVPSNLDGALSETEHRFPRAKLLLGKIVVKTWKCPLKPRAVAQILTSILAERFETVEIPVEPKSPRAVIEEATPDSSAVARRPTDWPETDIRLELQVQRMHFTPDGRYLVMLVGPAAFPAPSYAIEIWERGATEPLRVIKLPRTGAVQGLAVSPDGKYLVTGYQGLRIHEVPSGRLVGYLEGHRSRSWRSVLDVAFSPDGSLVASGSQDNTCRLWQFKSRKDIATFPHKSLVGSVCFEPSGKRLITACMFQEASEPFGDLQSFDFDGAGVVRFQPPKGDEVFWSDRLAISPDGRLLVAGCGGARASIAGGVWNLKTGRLLRLLTGQRIFGAFETVFSRDGAFLVTSHAKDIRVWSTKTWKCVSVMKGGAKMAITTDGRFLAHEDRKQKQVRIRPFTLP